MEEMHRTHKEPLWGWFATLDDWRRSRTRRRIRQPRPIAAPSSR
jgi:hypothetical protein